MNFLRLITKLTVREGASVVNEKILKIHKKEDTTFNSMSSHIFGNKNKYRLIGCDLEKFEKLARSSGMKRMNEGSGNK